jgi:hypothetical protein
VLLLSGSQVIGQFGMALIAAVAAVWGVGFVLKRDVWAKAGFAWGVVLYGLVLAGFFWAELTPLSAGLLLGAPVLAWVGEMPGVRELTRWKRSAVRVAVVLVPVLVAAGKAAVEFKHAQESQSPGSEYY